MDRVQPLIQPNNNFIGKKERQMHVCQIVFSLCAELFALFDSVTCTYTCNTGKGFLFLIFDSSLIIFGACNVCIYWHTLAIVTKHYRAPSTSVLNRLKRLHVLLWSGSGSIPFRSKKNECKPFEVVENADEYVRHLASPGVLDYR